MRIPFFQDGKRKKTRFFRGKKAQNKKTAGKTEKMIGNQTCGSFAGIGEFGNYADSSDMKSAGV